MRRFCSYCGEPIPRPSSDGVLIRENGTAVVCSVSCAERYDHARPDGLAPWVFERTKGKAWQSKTEVSDS
jgi:hypothetical protein